MTAVLVLGGTGWLGGAVAREWVARGADVTALVRGARMPPPGVSLAPADRDSPDAYEDVARRTWDEVVDVTRTVSHARAAVSALAGRARHWTCISTISVYADTSRIGADETASVLEPAAPDGPAPDAAGYDYGRAKVAIEDAVREGFRDTALIVRPGLIVGPGDPTDRFGYWVGRFAQAGGAPVLVPIAERRRAQVIDVRDLAAFIVHAGADAATGVIDAVGDSVPLADVLRRARAVAGHTGVLVPRDDDWLEAHDVAFWSGPRSLPLWLPTDMAGLTSRANGRYRSAGGSIRPLDETLADTLEDEIARGLDRPRASGLQRSEELALIEDSVAPPT